jgi:NTE family protein
MAKRKKLGLALGSGGQYGLYHIGVLRTLVAYDIPIDMIAGSSIGAWVGGHYALYRDIEKLEEFTNRRRTEKLFSFMELSFGKGIIKGAKLKKMLDNWLRHATFRKLQIPFRAIATDLHTGKQIIFKEGNLAFALRASMSYPSVFEPVPYKKYLLADGGMSNPVPDDIVRKMGADVVLSVNLERLTIESPMKKKRSITDVMQRSIDILLCNLTNHSLRDSDIILAPELESFTWFDYFTNDDGERLIERGMRDTARIIPALKKKLESEP